MTQPMKFEHEKGAGRSKWAAGALVLAIVGWMGSGYVFPSPSAEKDVPVTAAQAVKPLTVAIERSTARDVIDVFTAEGQAQAEKDVTIRAETGGAIAEVLVAKGERVEEGAVLARIAPAQRAADLERTRAQLAQAQRELANAEALLARGVATNDRVVQARSGLAAAEAGLANAEAAMADLDVKAPIGGYLERFALEPGEFISPGGDLGRIVQLDPLTVSLQVPQSAVAALRVGQPAQVNFLTGVSARGQVSFIGAVADASTRTFTAEVKLPNPNGEIPAGLSAEIYIPTGESLGHFLSPAIMSLNTDGVLGVKALGEGNAVLFYPVEILRAETDGLWVEGLPEELDIITIGQGFVNAGEIVDPKPAEELARIEEPQQ